MPLVAVLHPNANVRMAIRRGLPRRGFRMKTCRTSERLDEVILRELVDAVVLDIRGLGIKPARTLRENFPGIPLFGFSRFRPDDGRLLQSCVEEGLQDVLVQGVDDAAAGELIASRAASRRRRDALSAAPRLLRLTEPVQLGAWEVVLDRVGVPTQTSDVASALRLTREHLSREFAAGGAPNLKRVIDLVRAAWAADLLRNPGYSVRAVSAILGFSSPSHLAGNSRRVAGVTPAELPGLGLEGVLREFVRGRMRSRV